MQAMNESLLHQIVDKLQQHQAVRAAWLTGSRGRGTEDEFSDIDILIAIDDVEMPNIADDPLSFVHEIVPTIMHVNAPSIAPTDGAFIGSWVPTDDTFVQVDWYLTPTTSARRPADTKLLIGEVAVESTSLTQDLPDSEIAEKIRDNLVLALQMINNMVKHARRGHTWRAADHARHADNCLMNARWYQEHKSDPDFFARQNSILPEPVASDTSELWALALMLLDEAELIAYRADMEAEFASPVAGMREVVRLWQDSH